jgi:hypothetical protein
MFLLRRVTEALDSQVLFFTLFHIKMNAHNLVESPFLSIKYNSAAFGFVDSLET